MQPTRLLLAIALAAMPWAASARADVWLNAMFGDHMVLQQGLGNRVWGRAEPGESVTVTLGTQTHATTAAADGSWQVLLDPVEEYGGPHTLTVKGTNTISFNDVLIGEVWVCAGQSNMQWSIDQSKDADLEKAAARYPNIRLLTVPNVGTQEPQRTFNGRWVECSPETVGKFSAVGFHFGRQLHQTLGVPVGLVNNAWGGSAAEAWVKRETIAANEKLVPLVERWVKKEREIEAAKAEYPDRLAAWKVEVEKARAEGQRLPAQPLDPEREMAGNQRPGNIHSGVLTPSIGYGIRGVIWYQGESNSGRAYQYRELFPLLIRSWRQEWGIGDFPFYWVQLADYGLEKPGSSWAELREAQTMTMQAVPNVGEAVSIDLGEGKDIHPKNKQDVGRRLARWALSETYQVPQIPCRSPIYTSMEKEGGRIVLAFDHVTGGWRPFDVNEPLGFTIAGADRTFVPARAKIRPDGRIEVWSEQVADPVAVRYAWSDNPVCNMYSEAGLPLTPFRTDDFPGLTAEVH
ncbi:MAG: sialate O-acetylesterase [Planctomycetia bacterium]|nr:sialate O-acetylesterase [Planctomycetia bacterium]